MNTVSIGNDDIDDTFKKFRKITGWVRPPGSHGCSPTEIVPGLWTAHYHDIDSQEKLLSYQTNKK